MVSGLRITLWGFELVNEKRKHTTRVYVENNKGEELRIRMGFNFIGE